MLSFCITSPPNLSSQYLRAFDSEPCTALRPILLRLLLHFQKANVCPNSALTVRVIHQTRSSSSTSLTFICPWCCRCSPMEQEPSHRAASHRTRALGAAQCKLWHFHHTWNSMGFSFSICYDCCSTGTIKQVWYTQARLYLELCNWLKGEHSCTFYHEKYVI